MSAPAYPEHPRRSARTRRFTLGRPRSPKVAPDGARVWFLRSSGGEDPINGLWCFDVATAQEHLVADPRQLGADGAGEGLTPEERVRRERARELAGGITTYATDGSAHVAAFVLAGRVHRVDLRDGRTEVLATPGPAFDARPAPDGHRTACVVDGALYVIERDGTVREVASDPAETVTWGLAEFVAAEEIGRDRGYWWAPGGARLAVARVDVAPVDTWHLADPAHPDRPATAVRYPAAGTANADVQLAVVGLDGQRTPVAWDREALPYLVAVDWSEASGLTVTVQSRDQRRVVILRVDPDRGSCTTVTELHDPAWFEVVSGTPAWAGGRLVTVRDDPPDADDHAGTRRLYLDDRAVTPRGLQVRTVLHADDQAVWFTASLDPTEQHIHRLELASGEVTALTDGPGWHAAVAGGDVVVVSSARVEDGQAPTTVIRAGEVVGELTSHALTSDLTPRPRFLELGERALRGALLLPGDAGDRPLPVLLNPYGGPHASPRAVRTHHGFLDAQWFAEQGFAVLVVDGRGTPGRGPAWERAIHGDLAGPVLEDQVAALHAAARLEPRLDLGRVAIRGWSFGGYLAALAVLRRPDVFHAAIAGAPVTDWRLYDTHYTERYLGHPDADPEAYERSSLVGDDARLCGAAEPPGGRHPHLLLVHGLADDNVVVAHSLRLSGALLAAGRPHRFLPLSGVTHVTPQEVVAENLMRLQLAFLREALAERYRDPGPYSSSS